LHHRKPATGQLVTIEIFLFFKIIMSYTSESFFESHNNFFDSLKKIIELLGFVKINDGLKVPNRVGSYFWFENEDYKSWAGVELDIYKDNDSGIKITTRSRSSRSYWDLIHQNKTLKMLRDVFGGYFITDAGRNRYWRPDGKPPIPRESGCYLARWHFDNALIKPKMYLDQRGLDQPNAKPEPTGMYFIDEMNPRLFSNNLLLPYLFAVWEDFFRSSFIALLKYCDHRDAVLKKSNLNKYQLDCLAMRKKSFEEAISDSFSFQRPQVVSANFKILNSKLDIEGALKKPYRRRKESLFDTIEKCVEERNRFVHSGEINLSLSDKKLNKIISDFEVCIQRSYEEFSRCYDFNLLF